MILTKEQMPNNTTTKPMETKNQTAVEWLMDVNSSQGAILPAQFDQAIEIEKQQIIDAFFAGYNYEGGRTEGKAEQYYNQTYKK